METDIQDILKSVKTYSPTALAKHHGVGLDEIMSQLEMGTRIEQEHTSDPKVAREIALDHLKEMPDYYSRLKKMEESELQDILHRSGVQTEAKQTHRSLDKFESLITDIALRLIDDEGEMDPATAGMDILDAINANLMTESVRRSAGTWYDPMQRALDILEDELPEDMFADIASRLSGGDEYLRDRGDCGDEELEDEDEWEETSVGDIASELGRIRDGLKLGRQEAEKFDELIQQLHSLEESSGHSISFRLREWSEDEADMRKRAGLMETCACQMMDDQGSPNGSVLQQVIPELRGIAINYVTDPNAKQRLQEIAKELSSLQNGT